MDVCGCVCSVVSNSATPRTAARQASLSFIISQSWLKLMSIESEMPSNHLILCRPLLLLPSIFPSIRVFSNESVLCIKWPKYCSSSFCISSVHSLSHIRLWAHGLQHARPPCPSPTPRVYSNSGPLSRDFSNESVLCIKWPKYWSFSFSISTSNEYSGLIFFRMDWLGLLEVQGTLKSLLQHRSSKSINSSVLSFHYSPTLTSIHEYWKTIALTRRTFVGKIMSVLFNYAL